MHLAYADEGPGPVVVLLHGFPLSRAMWAEQLSGIGSIYRVIAPDLRGHGESPAPEGVYTMDEMADDVIEAARDPRDQRADRARGAVAGRIRRTVAVVPLSERVRGLDADGYAGGRRHARGGPGPRSDRPGCARGRQRRPVVDAMIARLFSKMTLEQRPNGSSR